MIHDVRTAWRWLSVQAAVVVAVLATASEYLPEVREYLPDGWVKWAALAILVARMVKQKAKP